MKIHQHALHKGAQKFAHHERAQKSPHSPTFSKSSTNNANQTNISHHDKALHIIDKILSNSAPEINHSSVEMLQGIARRKNYERERFFSFQSLNRTASDDTLKTIHHINSSPPPQMLPDITPHKPNQIPETPPNSLANSMAANQIHQSFRDTPNNFVQNSHPETPSNSLADSFSTNQLYDKPPQPAQSSHSILDNFINNLGQNRGDQTSNATYGQSDGWVRKKIKCT